MTFGGSLVRNARFADLTCDFWRKSRTKHSFWRLDVSYETLLGYGQTVWRNYVRDVAVPLGLARPWWEMHLRDVVPLGSAKHAGVNAACRW